jgi:leucyl-tRNA synthetase
MYPFGWDSFGLPTENYAIKMGVHPAVVTKKNSDNFRKQMKNLGLSFDWSREINTTDPKYYKWTQWIFIKLFEAGLAYKDKININWCPSCKIGLANEEVVAGNCERCGAKVEKREKEQWLIRITKYADRLINDLANVDYQQRIKDQQINWIGRSEGAEIDFTVKEKDEPTFYQFFEPGTIRDDKPFVERNAILAIVKHWKEEKYLGLKWKEVDWETFVTGGIERVKPLWKQHFLKSKKKPVIKM